MNCLQAFQHLINLRPNEIVFIQPLRYAFWEVDTTHKQIID